MIEIGMRLITMKSNRKQFFSRDLLELLWLVNEGPVLWLMLTGPSLSLTFGEKMWVNTQIV